MSNAQNPNEFDTVLAAEDLTSTMQWLQDLANAVANPITGVPAVATDVATSPVAQNIQSAYTTASDVWQGLGNITTNFGPFVIGILIFATGMGLLWFGFGERLADSAEKLVDKIGPTVAKVAEVA